MHDKVEGPFKYPVLHEELVSKCPEWDKKRGVYFVCVKKESTEREEIIRNILFNNSRIWRRKQNNLVADRIGEHNTHNNRNVRTHLLFNEKHSVLELQGRQKTIAFVVDKFPIKIDDKTKKDIDMLTNISRKDDAGFPRKGRILKIGDTKKDTLVGRLTGHEAMQYPLTRFEHLSKECKDKLEVYGIVEDKFPRELQDDLIRLFTKWYGFPPPHEQQNRRRGDYKFSNWNPQCLEDILQKFEI